LMTSLIRVRLDISIHWQQTSLRRRLSSSRSMLSDHADYNIATPRHARAASWPLLTPAFIHAIRLYCFRVIYLVDTELRTVLATHMPCYAFHHYIYQFLQ
jgi:hypothetical protein